MRTSGDAGSVDVRRKRTPHQPTGTDGGIHCREIVHKGPGGRPCSYTNRQYDHKKSNREDGVNKVTEPVQRHSRPLEILPGERYHADGRALERSLEHRGRQSFERVQRQEQLEAEVNGLPVNHADSGPSESRPVRGQDKLPGTMLLQLEAGPAGTGNRCYVDQVDGSRAGVCVPSNLHDREMPCKNTSRRDHCDHDYANLARAAVVLQAPTDVSGESDIDPKQPGSSARTGGRKSSTHRVRIDDSSGMENLRRNARHKGLSQEAKTLLQGKLAKGTAKTYASPWDQWCGWCDRRELDPVSTTVENIANFLSEHEKSHGYSALNTARSAISCYHDRIWDGNNLIPAGQHDLIKDLLDSAKIRNPPKPRYSMTWDVNIVLDYIKDLGPNAGLSLKDLTHKLAMLINLITVTRSQELSVLKISNIVFRSRNEIRFKITERTKTGRELVVLKKYTDCEYLDPVTCLESYLIATQAWREKDRSKDELFLAINNPHNPVKPCTIANWLTSLMDSAGVDITTYKPHSVRAASTSKVEKSKAMSCNQIIKAANWSNVNTFKKFYNRDIETEVEDEISMFTQAVLS